MFGLENQTHNRQMTEHDGWVPYFIRIQPSRSLHEGAAVGSSHYLAVALSNEMMMAGLGR